MEIKPLGENIFVFRFGLLKEKRRILEGSPWSFDKNIIVFQEYDLTVRPSELDFRYVAFWVRVYDLPIGGMKKAVAEKIGEMMGGLIKADMDEKGKAWGPFLRIRVQIDISKPLRRGIFLALNQGEIKRWYWVKYERLPNFCYNCGRLGHGERSCDEPIVEGKKHYGDWMRVNGDSRRLCSQSQDTDSPNSSSNRDPELAVLVMLRPLHVMERSEEMGSPRVEKVTKVGENRNNGKGKIVINATEDTPKTPQLLTMASGDEEKERTASSQCTVTSPQKGKGRMGTWKKKARSLKIDEGQQMSSSLGDTKRKGSLKRISGNGMEEEELGNKKPKGEEPMEQDSTFISAGAESQPRRAP